MTTPLCLELEWDVQQLSQLHNALHSYAHTHGWSDLLVHQINLMAEELAVNVMTYGSHGRDSQAPAGWVRVELDESEEFITLTISDNGLAYDPTMQATPDIDAPLEARQKGGLGVFLVRELSDALEYEYRNGINVVTVRKRRAAP